MFKRNAKVRWTSARGGRSGTGVIKEINETARGRWYVVKTPEGTTITLRAACLEAI